MVETGTWNRRNRMNQQNGEMSAAQAYAQDLMKKLQDGSKDLTSTEKTLGKKYMETQQRVMQASQEADNIEKQIRLSQDRLNRLKETISLEMGKAAGIMESMISIRPEASDDNGEKKDRPRPNVAKKAGEGAEV